ncbi:MAG: glycosyltransferase [Kiritimatiellia bacterium]
MKKRILHVLHHDGPGGGPQIMISLIRYLSADYDQAVFGGGQGTLHAYCTSNGIDYKDAGFTKTATWFLAVPGLLKMFRRFKPDVVITHGQSAGPVGGLACRLAGLHNLFYLAQWPAFYTDWDTYRLLRNRFSEWLACRFARKVVTFTPSSRHQFVLRRLVDEEQVMDIPAAFFDDHVPRADEIEALKNEHGWQRDELHVVSVGRLADQKNVALLIKSWPGVVARIPQARLWIVGDGGDRPGLEALAGSLGISSSCHFLGYRNNARAFIAAADLLVVTSMYESFGYVALEGCACGTPVLASKVDGLMDVIEDGKQGYLVPPGSPPELRNKIIQMLEDSSLRDRMAREGMQHATRFRPDAVYPAWVDLIESATRSALA